MINTHQTTNTDVIKGFTMCDQDFEYQNLYYKTIA